MNPTTPLFSIGEVAIIHPHYDSEISRPFKGQETIILEREWSEGLCGDGTKRWTWAYKTDKAPKNFYLQGKYRKFSVWTEQSLRKKYDAGMDFDSLLNLLNTPLVIEEVEWVR